MWRQPLAAAWKVWTVKACADEALPATWRPVVQLSGGALLASRTAALIVVPVTVLKTAAESMIAAVLTMTDAAPMMRVAPIMAAALMAADDSAMVSSGFPQERWLHRNQRMKEPAARCGATHWTPTLAMALLQ